jgi:hypothetical protein
VFSNKLLDRRLLTLWYKKKLGDRMTQWAEATQEICKLLEQMDALREVT